MNHFLELYKLLFVSYSRLNLRDRVAVGVMYIASSVIMITLPIYFIIELIRNR